MRPLRRLHLVAAFVAGVATAFAELGFARVAAVLFLLAVWLIVWSIDQLRAAVTRSPRP